MATAGGVYRFGPFALDPARRRLTRNGDIVPLPPRQMDVLLILVAKAGHAVSIQEIAEGAWPDTAVGDSSVAQAIRGLRVALGRTQGSEPAIATLVGTGYRFAAPVERAHDRQSPVALRWLLDPYRAFVEGRAALETFDRDEVERAGQAFAEALRIEPGLPAAHIGMASVCLLRFEATRVDATPDRTVLTQAERHADEGCQLAPSSADAWCTYALVAYRTGHPRDALAASYKALALEPDNWRHHLRMAAVTWGEDRVRAASRALALCPQLPVAHWFIATVCVARGVLTQALEQLREACALQDAQRQAQREDGAPRLTAVGSHWLRGLVLAATGAEEAAFDAFARELALENPRHVYGREAGANAWYATGALHLRAGRHDASRAAFEETVTRVPSHPCAVIGRLAAGPRDPNVDAAFIQRLMQPESSAAPVRVDAVVARAAALALLGKHDDAARLCLHALQQAGPGSAGWLLPVEPLLNTRARRAAWAVALADVSARAV